MKKVAFLNYITLSIRGVKPIIVSASNRLSKSNARGLSPFIAAYVDAGMAEVLN
ncbi:hypothetical protein [Vibrio sp. Evd11]|uniref:hypothetical protein n=1 Tax=Vibrio sp. Evd11 TaxID=1207404 RepID=UPI0013C51B44|nr:hypothetical protein [Vibrio sp. Evd11]